MTLFPYTTLFRSEQKRKKSVCCSCPSPDSRVRDGDETEGPVIAWMKRQVESPIPQLCHSSMSYPEQRSIECIRSKQHRALQRGKSRSFFSITSISSEISITVPHERKGVFSETRPKASVFAHPSPPASPKARLLLAIIADSLCCRWGILHRTGNRTRDREIVGL